MKLGEKCTCASCHKFPLSVAASADGGIARCPDMEEDRAWNDRACVLYMPAKDRENRKAIVIRLMKQE